MQSTWAGSISRSSTLTNMNISNESKMAISTGSYPKNLSLSVHPTISQSINTV